ncbi:toll/interleukin-1 receptor domain-containing protein [Streptomyces sp. NA02950]|uniref:toll/interleukin-1 receptor domain-containing protein n=1 Tax=Streptomyces sp. NA02950 TaxID=2742137 RepID=UPI00159167A4|nr:toll/interleukin-1 receptor domain-containing protein [Streptomyces sp. NA02950]QKV95284.1 toll/interleukin-1 receptor domain-containing protein [Streptomyces sp. NA02950]
MTVDGQDPVDEPGNGGTAGRPPRVFISYAHEDDGAVHRERVRTLWRLLCAQGVDAQLDALAAEGPRDWVVWMMHRYQEADFVVVVASPAYKRRAEVREKPGTGLGVGFEAGLLRAEVFGDPAAWFRRILRVVLPGGSADDFPAFLGGAAVTTYSVDPLTAAGAEKLLRYLHRLPYEQAPVIGPVPHLPPRPS